MANTRDFKSLGVVASDAIPVTEDGERTIGDSYRRTNLSDAQQVSGELFDRPTVNPRTEFLNQKIFNQSSFTDTIDPRGIPGWTNLVDYAPPAMVWASDGTPGNGALYFCLRENGPNSFVVDPVTDNQESPIYWRIFENPEQLRLDLADETPGTEGSRLVGYNNIDRTGAEEGIAVKTALDNSFLGLLGSKHFEILASANVVAVQLEGGPPPTAQVSTFSHFNTIPQNVVPIAKLDGVGDPENFIQGYRVTFENPIPVPYNVIVGSRVNLESTVVTERIRSIVGYENSLGTSIDIYTRNIELITDSQRFPATRIFNFICFRYNP